MPRSARFGAMAALVVLGVSLTRADDIHSAVMRNDADAVRAVLAADPRAIGEVNVSSETPLHRAAQAGLAEMVTLLLERGADPNAVAYSGFTPLHLTSSPEVVRRLMAGGADATRKDAWGKTPLQNAVQSDLKGAAGAMIDAGCAVDLSTALRLGRRDVAKRILAERPREASGEAGSDLWGDTRPLGVAAANGDVEMVKLLLAAGAGINVGTFMPNAGDDATALSNAVWGGHAEVVELLLERGASTRAAGGKYFNSIFDYALDHSSLRILELLLKRSALENEGPRVEWGPSALSVVCAGGELERVKLVERSGEAYFTPADRRRALLVAAAHQHAGVVDYLVERGTPRDVFADAVLGRDEAVMKSLGREGEFLRERDEFFGRTLLWWAIAGGRRELAIALLERGADPNRAVGAGERGGRMEESARGPYVGARGAVFDTESPLLAAMVVGYSGPERRADGALVHALLEKGADTRVRGIGGATPLRTAVRSNDLAVAADLLQHGADPNSTDAPWPAVLSDVTSAPMAELLLAHGANPNPGGRPGYTPLDAAVNTPETGVAEVLLAHGARMSLFAACVLGKPDAVREFIERDASLIEADCSTGIGVSPLVVAAEHGQVAVIRVLLDAGAKLVYSEAHRITPLGAAAQGGSVEAARALMDRGAALESKFHQGSALHTAAMWGRVDMVKFLVERGADVNAHASGGGWTPLEAAASWSGSAEVAEFLIGQGALVNASSKADGGTALHCAARKGNGAVAKVLLAHGADASIRDVRGKTALDWALWDSEYLDEKEKAGKAEVAALLKGPEGGR